MSNFKQKYHVVDNISDLFKTGVKELDESEAAKRFFDVVDGKVNISDNKEKCVYAIKFFDGALKIGVSFHPDRRIRYVALSSGREIKDFYITKSVSNPYEIEKKVKEYLEPFHIKGEFYRVNFQKAVGKISQLVRREKRNGC